MFPPELLVNYVFMYSDYIDITKFGLVNKEWNLAANRKFLWDTILRRHNIEKRHEWSSKHTFFHYIKKHYIDIGYMKNKDFGICKITYYGDNTFFLQSLTTSGRGIVCNKMLTPRGIWLHKKQVILYSGGPLRVPPAPPLAWHLPT